MAVLELTTIARVKAYGFSGTTVTDGNTDLLSDMIKSVSQRFADYCSRSFLKQEWTDTRILNGSLFPLLNTPVASITSVSVSESGRRSGMVAISSTQYEIAPDGNGIKVWDVPRGSLVEVVYEGGLAEDTTGLIANFPALEGACLLQVKSLFNRHLTPDRTTTDLGGGSTSWVGEYDLLK